MSLSRKHYCAVAAVIGFEKDPLVALSRIDDIAAVLPRKQGKAIRSIVWGDGELVPQLADYFASDNPNFDRSRFLAACKVQS
jgi:hypothetical protein